MSAAKKVWMDAQGRKYVADTAKATADMHIPHVTVAYYEALSAEAATDAEISERMQKNKSAKEEKVSSVKPSIPSGSASGTSAAQGTVAQSQKLPDSSNTVKDKIEAIRVQNAKNSDISKNPQVETKKG